MATFNGGLSAASIYGGTGKDTLDFNNVVVNGTTFQGGLGNDVFSGAISAGSSDVSFWGGAGDDSFGFDYISNGAGTAYFWNDTTGTDTIVFDGATNTNNFGYGVAATGAFEFVLDASYTSAFSAAGISGLFTLGGASNRATALFSSNAVTLDYADGTSIMFSANGPFTAAFATGFGLTMTNAGAGRALSTLDFGSTGTIPTFS